MKINVAKYAGFCFGVRRALDIALKTAQTNKHVYMLGDIVHNENVVKDIKKAGIQKAAKLNKGKGKTLLIRAHGASLYTINKAKRLGYKVQDATCPMVKEIHKIAAGAEEKGYKIIVIGDKKHDEVQGIIGQLKSRTVVIDPASIIRYAGKNPLSSAFKAARKIRKACVVVQSTQNSEEVLKITGILKSYIKELKFFNTICKPTRIKQQEIKTMAEANEAMIIIGSKTSANTRRLFEISQSLNPRSYWIESKKEINPAWFKDTQSLGICAGASTPDSTTQGVVKYIKNVT